MLLAQLDKVTPDNLHQFGMLAFALLSLGTALFVAFMHWRNMQINAARAHTPAPMHLANQPVRATVEGTVTTASAAKQFDPSVCASLHRHADERFKEHDKELAAIRAELRVGQDNMSRQIDSLRNSMESRIESLRAETKKDVGDIYGAMNNVRDNTQTMLGEMKHINISLAGIRQHLNL
jgi:hypothetical protein